MRIIGGEARGRTITSPKGMKVRPTPDLIREALFNILTSVQGTTFLDLFAGTGSVGLEALSRGAKKVVFIEKNARMTVQITNIIRELHYEAHADVFTQDIKAGISRLAKVERKFDIIFADPPYAKDLISRTIQYCLDSGLMGEGDLMVLQHSIREPLCLKPQYDTMTLSQERRYGDTALSFLHYSRKEH